MKYYKIYAKAVRKPHPVEELTDWEKEEALNEAIEYKYEAYLDSNGTAFIGDEETKALYEKIAMNDEEERLLNALYENIASHAIKELETIGSIAAGDWGLIVLNDEEDPWEHRPNVW